MKRYTSKVEKCDTSYNSKYGVPQEVIDNPKELFNLFDKLGQYEDLEEKIQGHYQSEEASLAVLVDLFIGAIETADREKYKGYRVLTGQDCLLYDEWKKSRKKETT